MPIETIVKGGRKGHSWNIGSRGDGLASILPGPPDVLENRIIFKKYLTLDGSDSGATSMLVDGSSTPQKFKVLAHSSRDRYLTMASIVISDSGPVMNKFGNSTALTNGCLFQYFSGREFVDIHGIPLRTNYDFFRMANFNRPFGVGSVFNELANIVGLSEGLIIMIDFRDFIPPFGIKLEGGSTQEISLTIQDDLSGTIIDGFDGYVNGFEVIK